MPFSTTRPPDDVAEAFDRLKTENAALRHELAQSLKAADVLAAGGVAAATMAQSLADKLQSRIQETGIKSKIAFA